MSTTQPGSATDPDEVDAPAPPVPLVRAEALSLDGPAGPVFHGVDVEIVPGTLVVVLGPTGSGRSSLLLALSGRMRGCTGTLTLDGSDRPRRRDPHRLRQRSAIARLADLVGPEDRLDVAQSLTERALIDAVRPAAAVAAFAQAQRMLAVRLDAKTLVEQLGGRERTALAVSLALLRPTDLVVLDDLDAGLDLAEQADLMVGLRRVARSGPAVLVSTTERAAVPADAAVITLPTHVPAHATTPSQDR